MYSHEAVIFHLYAHFGSMYTPPSLSQTRRAVSFHTMNAMYLGPCLRGYRNLAHASQQCIAFCWPLQIN